MRAESDGNDPGRNPFQESTSPCITLEWMEYEVGKPASVRDIPWAFPCPDNKKFFLCSLYFCRNHVHVRVRFTSNVEQVAHDRKSPR